MKDIDLSKYKAASIGKNVKLSTEHFNVSGKFTIGDNVTIEAKTIQFGHDCNIESDTVVRSIRNTAERFVLGDYGFVGFESQILVPSFWMGDYSQIHNHALVSGYKPITIGHNCWVGQNSILNSTETLTLGNNVRIGTQSQLWTHVSSGEILEGCTLFGSHPLTLEDNVWIVGGGVISPGLVVRRNSIIMTGSVLTKSTEPFHTYAGVPAKDITEKLNVWNVISLDEKFSKLKEFIQEFIQIHPSYEINIVVANSDKDDNIKAYLQNKDCLVFLKKSENIKRYELSKCSIFDLNSKTYTKRNSQLEVDWMKFSVGYRARFIPVNYI